MVVKVKVHSIGVSQSLDSTASRRPRWARSHPECPKTSAVRRAHAPHAVCRMEARNIFGTMSCALASRRPRHTSWAPDMADCDASLEAGPRKPTPPLRLPWQPRHGVRSRRTEHMQRATSCIRNLRGRGRGDGHTRRASTSVNQSGGARPWFALSCAIGHRPSRPRKLGGPISYTSVCSNATADLRFD